MKIDTGRRDGDYTCLEGGKHRPRTIGLGEKTRPTSTERKKTGELGTGVVRIVLCDRMGKRGGEWIELPNPPPLLHHYT